MAAINNVKLDVYSLKHSVDNKLIQLTQMRDKIITYKPEVINDLDELINEYHQLLHNTCDYINTQFINFYPFMELISPFVMNPSENDTYTFVSGYSPWKFLLKLNREDDFENIKSIILNELSSYGLTKCKYAPENGTVVLVSDKGCIYRAFIMETKQKMLFKIMNIDTGEFSTVALDSLNDLPHSLALFPPQVFYCCLLTDRFHEKYWNHHFSNLFQSIMKKMKFSIQSLEQISINPLYYKVHLKAVINDYETDVSSDWVYKIFFHNGGLTRNEFEFDYCQSEQDNQSIDERLDNSEELEVDHVDNVSAYENNGNENDFEFIKNVFENFSRRYIADESSSEFRSQEEEEEDEAEVLPLLSSEEQLLCNDHDTHDEDNADIQFLNTISNETLQNKETCNRFEESISDNGDEDSHDSEDELLSIIKFFDKNDCETINYEAIMDQYYLEVQHQAESSDYKEENVDLSNLENNKKCLESNFNEEENSCRLQESPKAEEPHLEESIEEDYVCRFHAAESSSELDLEENLAELELLEADIGEECEDEVKTCKFQIKDGHCWKEYCPREHINPGPGYIGSVWTYGYFEGEYPLPEEKEIVCIKPKMILSGHIFYGHLIDYMVWNQPDLKLLEKRMNSKEEYLRFEHFHYLPTIGELCLANGKSNRWYRARVIEVDETSIQVSSVDYGYTEKVLIKNIRKMKYDYLFLPPQAIRCVIYGIKANEDRKTEAKEYMRDVALNKTFKAVVKESYQDDSCIEVSLICPSGLQLQASLIAKGYYDNF